VAKRQARYRLGLEAAGPVVVRPRWRRTRNFRIAPPANDNRPSIWRRLRTLSMRAGTAGLVAGLLWWTMV
jgi:hypothetical protein